MSRRSRFMELTMPMVHGVKHRRAPFDDAELEKVLAHTDARTQEVWRLAEEALDRANKKLAMAAIGTQLMTKTMRVDSLSPRQPAPLWKHPPDGVLVRYAGTTRQNRGLRRTLLSLLGLR